MPSKGGGCVREEDGARLKVVFVSGEIGREKTNSPEGLDLDQASRRESRLSSEFSRGGISQGKENSWQQRGCSAATRAECG